jgi:Tfp pilus assembly protein PilW
VKQLFQRVHQWLTTTHSSPSPRAGDHGGHGDHGASLVEVMVAMVISAVLLASIVGLLDSSSSAARSMETRAEINERSALLQDRLGAVLRGAMSVTFASETEICTTARSRVPIDQVTTVSATAYESAPRDTCVRVEGSTIQAVTTTSGSPSSELILNGATGSAFTFFDAEATALTVDPVTGQISDTDLALIRRVGFASPQSPIASDAPANSYRCSSQWVPLVSVPNNPGVVAPAPLISHPPMKVNLDEVP